MAASAGSIAVSPPATAANLTKREKVAILLMSMGAEAAGQIFRNLNEIEIEELTAAITKVSSIPERVRQEVLTDFLNVMRECDPSGNGAQMARTLLSKTLGEEKASVILEHAETTDGKRIFFEFLEQAETPQVVNVLKQELPQTIALVLAHLKPSRAAEILTSLPTEVQTVVVERIATMERVSPAVVRRVEEALQRQFNHGHRDRPRPTGGAKAIAEILNFANRDIEKRVFENLKENNPALVDDIKRQMLVFEDLVKLTDPSMQAILREVDMSILCLALKGASDGMKALVFRNLSQRAMERLKEELDLLGPKARSEVKQAQEQVVAVARKLEEDGKINLGRGGGTSDELIP